MNNLIYYLISFQHETSPLDWKLLGETLVSFRQRIAIREVKGIKPHLNKLFSILNLNVVVR